MANYLATKLSPYEEELAREGTIFPERFRKFLEAYFKTKSIMKAAAAAGYSRTRASYDKLAYYLTLPASQAYLQELSSNPPERSQERLIQKYITDKLIELIESDHVKPRDKIEALNVLAKVHNLAKDSISTEQKVVVVNHP